MDQSGDVRMRNVLQISTELRKQMDEVRQLRMTLRLAEGESRGKRRIDIGATDTEFHAWP